MTSYPIYEYFQVTTPPIFVPTEQKYSHYYTGAYKAPNGTVIPVTFNLGADVKVNFTAKGSLSVNNPITVNAIVTPNDTEFMTDYLCIGFTGAYLAKSPTLPACLLFTSLNNGDYSANGVLLWLISGQSWVVIYPQGTSHFLLSELEKGDPIIAIAGVSDTLAISSAENNARLTWVLIAFSFLMLQPVFEALAIRESNKNSETTSEAPKEGLWHQYHKGHEQKENPSHSGA
jgi:hypothetical protein